MDSTTDQSSTAGENGGTDRVESVAASPPATADRRADRAKHYQRVRMCLSAAEWMLEVLILVALLAGGWSVAIRDWALESAQSPWLVVLVYLLPIGAVFAVVSMGFGAVRTFVVDRRYGLSSQSAGVWLADGIKALLLGGALALAAVEVLYALLRRFPDTWWLLAGLVFGAFLFFFVHLAPVLIFPLFFKFTRLADEEITRRVDRLARRAGTRLNGVYEVNLSRKTRAANAALVGFGRTRRIVLADNLLDNFTLDEIETVLAHEFAHHAQHHLGKTMAIQTATFFLLFGGIHLVVGHFGFRWGLEGATDVANFPLVALAGTLFGLVLLPITNALLRRFERTADDHALEAASRPWAFCSALRRLGQLNLADHTPHPFIEWMFYSHPALGSRIERIEAILRRKGIEDNASKMSDHTSK